MHKQLLLSALLLAVASGAFAQRTATPDKAATAAAAQTIAAPELTPAQKVQIEKQNTQMAAASLQVAQMVDQKQIGQVWDSASTVAKQTNTRADFVRQVSADRAQLGAIESRKLRTITRVQSRGGKLPLGMYINIHYTTQFANAKQPIRELISYHLDDDNVWRVAGYTLR